MPIPFETPIATTTANGVTTLFPHSFTVLDTADLVVKTELSGVVSYPVEGVDYAVAGVGSSSGSITFASPPANGTKVTRYRDTVLERTTDYQENGDLLAETLDQDIDRVVMMVQELFAGGKGAPTSIRVPNGETVGELPSAADRALRILSFDSLGAPLLIPGVVSDSAVALALDLASSVSASKGAGQIGFNSALTYGANTVGKSLKDAQTPAYSSITGKPTTLPGYGVSANDPFLTRQVQSVSASVAANALTVGLSAATLDFRNTSLTNGSATTITMGSAVSLVVPSAATLGTVNGVASRLALLAINNAGTVELAITNLSGGANLDETTLISTTAISGLATSASTIYSTTARSNVAFRVVGFIDITEATAGTWATAPTLVQGNGGNAATAMQSLGYGQTHQDLTASRSFGTVYYNTTGRPIQVYVRITWTSGVGSVRVTVNSIPYDGTVMSAVNQTSVISVIVPAGGAYTMNGTNSIGFTLTAWNELR